MARAAEPGMLIPNFIGFDHRLSAICLARAMWLRGFPDQACRIAKSAIDELLSGVHPLSTCVSLTYASSVFLWSGDFRSADGYGSARDRCLGRLDRAVRLPNATTRIIELVKAYYTLFPKMTCTVVLGPGVDGSSALLFSPPLASGRQHRRCPLGAY